MDVLTNEREQSVNAIQFIVRNFKILFFIPLATALVCGIITYFLPKKYESSGIVFPTAFNSITKNLDNPTFGYDIEADRLIQILKSREITDSIVVKYDLLNYYGIDRSDKNWNFKLLRNFRRDVRFERTPYMSVVITVETHNPELSSDIVNSIIDLADRTRDKIMKTNVVKAFESLSKEYASQLAKLDSLAGKIQILREKSGTNFPSLVPGQMVVAPSGKQGDNTELEILVNRYQFENHQLDITGEKLEMARQQLNQPIQGIYVLDRAIPNYHKTSPSMRVNVVIAWAGALIFCIAGLLIRKEYRLYKRS